MPVLSDDQMKQILEYNIDRIYFGQLNTKSLYNALDRVKNNANENFTYINIGRITNKTICTILWREMSYNPMRFGDESPFKHNGKNNLFHFCKTPGKYKSIDTEKIMNDIRWHIKEFLKLNSVNNSWTNSISAPDGLVRIGVDEFGNPDKTYSMLMHLCTCIQIIARQNIADFKNKKNVWRNCIIANAAKRHPTGFRSFRYANIDPRYAHLIANQRQR